MAKIMEPDAAEASVRKAAAALKAAIEAAHAAGLRVAWPARPEDLDGIPISTTGRAKVSVVAQVPAGDPPVAPETLQKAQSAAQDAANKVLAEPPAQAPDPAADKDKTVSSAAAPKGRS